MIRALWSIMRLVELLAWHVIRLSGENPDVRDEIEATIADVREQVADAEGV